MIVCGVPLYQSEVSPPHTRGVIVGVHGALLCTGYSVAGWVGYGCYSYTGQFQWRFPLAVQCFAPTMVLLGLFFIPESPRWRKWFARLAWSVRGTLTNQSCRSGPPRQTRSSLQEYGVAAP
jgi:MFS family permease